MTAPVLHTARLILRPPVAADFADYAAFLASDRAWGMGGPLSLREAWAFFCNDTAQWQLYGLGALMITTGAAGPAIGQVAVCHGPLFPEPELGWLLYDGHEGQGYVHEAAGALRDWAFDTRGLETLVSYVMPANAASCRVAERLGGVPDPDAATPFGEPDLTWRYHPERRAA